MRTISKLTKATLGLFILCTLAPSLAFGEGPEVSSLTLNTPEPTKQCAQLVKDCFSAEDKDRSNCFFSASRHPFCEGTSLGKVTYQRWIMSPYHTGIDQDAPGFLGPRLVDKECLANFDSQFMGKLLDAENSAALELFSGLEAELLKCSKEISQELTRP
ncbi:MAG: hypothetical protein KDD64_05365 [Bdellovibrionales bacterium]|nr:hypothetical protein [Bdellovibrionales bacterium]